MVDHLFLRDFYAIVQQISFLIKDLMENITNQQIFLLAISHFSFTFIPCESQRFFNFAIYSFSSFFLIHSFYFFID